MYANTPWDWMAPWHMWGVFPLLMMILMVAACAFLMSRMLSGRSSANPSSSALRILGERFARGEISKEEYEEKRTILVTRA